MAYTGGEQRGLRSVFERSALSVMAWAIASLSPLLRSLTYRDTQKIQLYHSPLFEIDQFLILTFPLAPFFIYIKQHRFC